MDAVARFHPFDHEGVLRFEWVAGESLLTIIKRAIAVMETAKGVSYQWFLENGLARVNGLCWAREHWAIVKPKPGAFVDFLPDIAKGKVGRIGLILAGIALTVATGFIATGGIASALGLGAGSTFGAGGFGALAASTALGAVGSLALKGLTPAPVLGGGADTASAEQRELSTVGVDINRVDLREPLPFLIGRRRLSPPLLVPPFVEFENETFYSNAMVGLHGPCDVQDIRINDIPIEDIQGAVWEVREGAPGSSADTFLSNRFVIESTAQTTLSNFETESEDGEYDILKDRVTPDNSHSKWHRLEDWRGEADDYEVRLAFPYGIIRNDAEKGVVAFRMRTREKGQTVWQDLPTFYFQDIKANGAIEQRIRFTRSPFEGYALARNEAVNAYLAHGKTGAPAQPFAFSSDLYFSNDSVDVGSPAAWNQVPVLASNTNGTVTVSASTVSGANAAFRAADNNAGTFWQPNDLNSEQWWKIDWGAGNTKTLRSLSIQLVNVGSLGKVTCTLEGSDNDVDFTALSTWRLKAGSPAGFVQAKTIAAYRYHRIRFTPPGANLAMTPQVTAITLNTQDAIASMYDVANFEAEGTTNRYLARRVQSDIDGFLVYMNPAIWGTAKREIEIRRSWAFAKSLFILDDVGVNDFYRYDGTDLRARFFTHQLISLVPKIFANQRDIQSTASILSSANFFASRPIRADIEQRLTRIAVRAPNLRLSSISALFTAKARQWTGSEWSTDFTPCRYAPPFMRDLLLLDDRNASAVPGEVVNDDSFKEAFLYAQANDLTCDVLTQGRSIDEVLALAASSLRASPRQADWWGLVIDRDRTGEDEMLLLTPENSRNLGARIDWPRIPHAVRVTYLDSADDDKPHDVTVYRPGFSALNATRFESLTDVTADTEAKAVATQNYNFGQMLYRKESFRFEVFYEGHWLKRGDLVAFADETLLRYVHTGLIKSVLTAAGMVTGFELFGVARLSETQNHIDAISDFDAIPDVDAPLVVPLHAQVAGTDGTVQTLAITNVADSNVIMLTTPVADTGQFVAERVIAIGPLGLAKVRCIIKAKRKTGPDTFELLLVRDAPEIDRPA